MATDSARFIPSTKGRSFPVEIPTRDEMNALLKAFSRKGRAGVRNRALVTVMWRAGLRVQEALDLQPRDIDFNKSTVNVRSGKGGKQRIVGIDEQALAVIGQWNTIRNDIGATRNHPLFCQITKGAVGAPLDQSYVRAAVRRAGARAGIDKRLHCHAFRHACASEMAAEGLPLNTIQAQLGHSSLVVTQRYIARISPHQLVQTMRNRSWH